MVAILVKVAIFIPVSRPEHLDRLFAALEMMTCDAAATSLFTYVDGDAALFLKARNLTEGSKFAQRLCVQRPDTGPTPKSLRYSREARRIRISEIHNEAKELLGECQYVLGLEDDGIPPAGALQRLLADYAAHPYAGFIEGVELGRWGIPYVGAWRADDVYEPKRIASTMPPGFGPWLSNLRGGGASPLLEQIDAGGFYCYLTKRQHFVGHTYEPFDRNSLGPDVQFGLWLRRQGLKNYIDWSVVVEHRVEEMGQTRTITLLNTEPEQAVVEYNGKRWTRS